MDRDEAKMVLAIGVSAIALVIGAMFYSLKTFDREKDLDPVYKCKVTDGREFLAYERHLRKSSGLIKARGHDGGSTWYDIMVPVIAVDACIKTEQVMP